MNNNRWLSTILCLLLAACNTTPAKPPETTTPVAAEPVEVKTELPDRAFPDDSFHDLLVAEFAVRRQQYDLALGYYMQQSVETRDPGVTARTTRLAQFLQADNAALDAAQLWTEIEPDSLEAQYTTATMLARKSRPLEALPHMISVMDNGGKTNFPAIAASALKLDLDTRTELERAFDTLLLDQPQNAQLHTSKALLEQQRGDADGSLQSIRSAISYDQNDLHAVIIEARLLQQLKRPDEAIARLESAIAEHPKNRRLRLQYARLLMAKDIDLARQQFEQLLLTTPNDADLLLSLALINKESDRPAQAEQYFQKLLTTGKRNNEANYYLAQLAEAQGNLPLAIEHYRAIPVSNDYMAATARIAELYLKLANPDQAQQHLQTSRQQHPQFSLRIYLLEAELLMRTGELDESVTVLNEALLNHPNQPNLLYLRSMVFEKQANYQAMEQDLRAVISIDPSNAVALNALGYILANNGEKLDEAKQMIERALSLRPDDPAILDSLGWVEFRRGNLAAALSHLEKAFAAFPDPEVAAHLGETLWFSQQQERAKALWQSMLKQHPNSEPLLETINRLMPNNQKAEPEK